MINYRVFYAVFRFTDKRKTLIILRCLYIFYMTYYISSYYVSIVAQIPTLTVCFSLNTLVRKVKQDSFGNTFGLFFSLQ